MGLNHLLYVKKGGKSQELLRTFNLILDGLLMYDPVLLDESYCHNLLRSSRTNSSGLTADCPFCSFFASSNPKAVRI